MRGEGFWQAAEVGFESYMKATQVAFIDQCKNWSIPLSDFPVPRKGKSDASESFLLPEHSGVILRRRSRRRIPAARSGCHISMQKTQFAPEARSFDSGFAFAQDDRAGRARADFWISPSSAPVCALGHLPPLGEGFWRTTIGRPYEKLTHSGELFFLPGERFPVARRLAA